MDETVFFRPNVGDKVLTRKDDRLVYSAVNNDDGLYEAFLDIL